MQILIFIFFLVFFSFIVSVVPFFKKAGIGRYTLIILFLIKIVAGVAYAKFYMLSRYYAGADTWRFYRWSLSETKWCLQNPAAFIKDIFVNNYSESGNLFSGQNSYWNDLKSNVIIKLMAVINIFTNSSYYADIIFFNFLFLFGPVALFRIFIQIFPDKKWLVVVGTFLLPSALFWGSGIHKDGLILSAAGLVIYFFYKGLKNTFTVRSVLIIVACLLIIFSLRNFIFFALLPALFAWALCKKYKEKNTLLFAGVYISAIIFCLLISLIFPHINILSFISNKQHEFLLLEGGSKVNMPELKPAVSSFIAFAPYAIDMAFFRPHLTEFKNISYLPALIENSVFIVLLFISAFKMKLKTKPKPVILFMFFFSISIILLAGYSIPFAGAIIRYKSIFLPLLITPLLCNFKNLRFKENF